MSRKFRDSQRLAIGRFYQATAQVYDELSSEISRGISDEELRISWQLNHSAAHRMTMNGLELGSAPREWPTREADISEVRNAICFLVTNSKPEIIDYAEKQLARSFEAKYADALVLDVKHGSDDDYRIRLDGLSESLSLSDAQAITHDWDATNQRRVDLIEKEISGELSGREAQELACLQKLAWAKRNITVPLPVQQLALIRAALARQRELEEEG